MHSNMSRISTSAWWPYSSSEQKHSTFSRSCQQAIDIDSSLSLIREPLRPSFSPQSSQFVQMNCNTAQYLVPRLFPPNLLHTGDHFDQLPADFYDPPSYVPDDIKYAHPEDNFDTNGESWGNIVRPASSNPPDYEVSHHTPFHRQDRRDGNLVASNTIFNRSRSLYSPVTPTELDLPLYPLWQQQADILNASFGDGITSDDSPIEADDVTSDKPYAQLIYEALKQAPGNKMSLRELYDWFQLNTNKPSESGTNGWQNSIRHNLSMNKAFENDKTDTSSGRSGARKANSVWVLTADALENGVQSTTRYRKNGASKRIPSNRTLAESRQRSGAKGGRAARRTARLRRQEHNGVKLLGPCIASEFTSAGFMAPKHETDMLSACTPAADTPFTDHSQTPFSSSYAEYLEPEIPAFVKADQEFSAANYYPDGSRGRLVCETAFDNTRHRS